MPSSVVGDLHYRRGRRAVGDGDVCAGMARLSCNVTRSPRLRPVMAESS
jgi:hypothetical protein